MSHPTWVRGLKLRDSSIVHELKWSHPTWVRGLKPPIISSLEIGKVEVAPYVGAWIETPKLSHKCSEFVRRTLRGCVD